MLTQTKITIIVQCNCRVSCKFIDLQKNSVNSFHYFLWYFQSAMINYNVLIKPILQIDSVLIICKNYNVTFDWKYMMTVIIIKRADFLKFPPIRRINIMSWCYYLWMKRDVISNHDFLVPYNKKECHEIFTKNGQINLIPLKEESNV